MNWDRLSEITQWKDEALAPVLASLVQALVAVLPARLTQGRAPESAQREQFDALRLALVEGSPQALELLGPLTEPLRQRLGARHQAFCQAVRQFDFDAALSLLDAPET